jgi:hypothetical protein
MPASAKGSPKLRVRILQSHLECLHSHLHQDPAELLLGIENRRRVSLHRARNTRHGCACDPSHQALQCLPNRLLPVTLHQLKSRLESEATHLEFEFPYFITRKATDFAVVTSP